MNIHVFGICARCLERVATHVEMDETLSCVACCRCPRIDWPAAGNGDADPAPSGIVAPDGPTCPICGSICVRTGSCQSCPTCFWSTGCD